MNLEADDEDLIDYLNQLREAILESYTGIIQGLKEDNKALMMSEHVAHIVNFIKVLVSLTSGDRSVDVHGRRIYQEIRIKTKASCATRWAL